MLSGFSNIYENVVLKRPVATIVAVAALVLSLGWFAQYFSLDASADSLTLERDAELRYYRFVRARYGSDDFLLVTYTPDEAVFSDATLADIRTLRDALSALPNVESVTSILDVPLVDSPPVNLRNIASGIRYLKDEDTDRKLAEVELLTSPLYENLLMSSDGLTTALRIDMHRDLEYRELREKRDALREKQFLEGLSEDESKSLEGITFDFDAQTRRLLAQQERDIAAVRTILDQHRASATMHLGGVPMIVADSIEFIRHDLLVFSIAVFFFLVVILGISFHRRRWVMLPLITCAATCIALIGLLGRLDWRVTVVSSNFVSLVLILCLALTLHIIVRYREIHEANPDADQLTLVRSTIRKIVEPCFYTALTTIVAFGSLLVSGIRPVIDFGWIMSIGIAIAFILSFTLFPAVLMLLKPGKPTSRNDLTAAITSFFARLTLRHGNTILLAFSALVLFGLVGVTQLTVENRFIDYYRQSTEIYSGMELIDRKLGGTTPLDVIIDAPADLLSSMSPPDTTADDFADDYADEFDDIYADESASEAGITSRSYWFNSRQLGQVTAIHDYLDALPHTGKVLSLSTFVRVLEQLDAEAVKDNFTLSIIYKKLPDDVRQALFAPYLSEDGNQLRYNVRVFESDPSLQRAQLLQEIRAGLTEQLDIDDSRIHLSGMLVLYNNMLQSLFRSQIMTLSVVFLAIMLMFLLLFRSLKTAMVAIVPNLTSACLVLGLMGWLGIPLDLMTITIAAITVGIGVDDTIHYVHRFRREFSVDGDYRAAVARCHRSIGRAIYYTSVTIMLGFSVLALSRFIPTIYFGLLTSLAMLVALLANMTLLPVLIVTFATEGTANERTAQRR
ncbi:MAG: transporter [Gammaproteobacteria bacterium]|nr:MAG: transporter [Gammaproteobacteria bacterium]RLA34692.1 MAG: transporter [Gammaproteobacteria bacterium]